MIPEKFESLLRSLIRTYPDRNKHDGTEAYYNEYRDNFIEFMVSHGLPIAKLVNQAKSCPDFQDLPLELCGLSESDVLEGERQIREGDWISLDELKRID